MKNIAFFLTSFNAGGMERMLINYANCLSEKYSVTIITCNDEGELRGQVAESVKILGLGNVRLRNTFFLLRTLISRDRFDSIISGGNSLNCLLILATRFMRRRPQIIISQHCYPNIEQTKLGLWSKIEKWATCLFYPMADWVVAVSDGIKKYLSEEIGIPSNKLVLIYNCIDINKVYKESNEEIKGDLPQRFILFLGRMSVVKNVPLILDSFDKANIGDCHLLLLGDGDQLHFLKRYAESLRKKDMIHFAGAVSNPFPYLKRAKALVLASFSEAFSLVVVEALSLDVPIVTTPSSGPVEILTGKNGTFVTNSFDNSDEYARAIEKVLSWPRQELKKQIENYKMEKSVSMLEFLTNVSRNR